MILFPLILSILRHSKTPAITPLIFHHGSHLISAGNV